ncbi:hypothetical protein DFH27DRAFT_568894 [Peziza echinospora]|nr:hypothetical protein DFH27DRAFT_568894 [Peziza echinospora]
MIGPAWPRTAADLGRLFRLQIASYVLRVVEETASRRVTFRAPITEEKALWAALAALTVLPTPMPGGASHRRPPVSLCQDGPLYLFTRHFGGRSVQGLKAKQPRPAINQSNTPYDALCTPQAGLGEGYVSTTWASPAGVVHLTVPATLLYSAWPS